MSEGSREVGMFEEYKLCLRKADAASVLSGDSNVSKQATDFLSFHGSQCPFLLCCVPGHRDKAAGINPECWNSPGSGPAAEVISEHKDLEEILHFKIQRCCTEHTGCLSLLFLNVYLQFLTLW